MYLLARQETINIVSIKCYTRMLLFSEHLAKESKQITT
ncbi:unnamed protein product, partial [marine sediment metagenome]